MNLRARHVSSSVALVLSIVAGGLAASCGTAGSESTLDGGGSGLLSGLWEAAGQRKRANAESVLKVRSPHH